MKNYTIIIIAIILALLQTTVDISLAGYGLKVLFVGITSLGLFFSGRVKEGSLLLVVGSIILDVYSPFRFGLYTFFASLVIFSLTFLINRPIEYSHPLILWISTLICLLLLNIFEIFTLPNYGLFITSIMLNAVLSATLVYILTRMNKKVTKKIELIDL